MDSFSLPPNAGSQGKTFLIRLYYKTTIYTITKHHKNSREIDKPRTNEDENTKRYTFKDKGRRSTSVQEAII